MACSSILLSLQHLNIEDLYSKILSNRELDPESKHSASNEVSTVVLMSKKLRIQGSPTWQR